LAVRNPGTHLFQQTHFREIALTLFPMLFPSRRSSNFCELQLCCTSTETRIPLQEQRYKFLYDTNCEGYSMLIQRCTQLFQHTSLAMYFLCSRKYGNFAA